MTFLLAFLLAACAARRPVEGLIDAPDAPDTVGAVELITVDGDSWTLRLGDEGAPLRWAEGLRVAVTGPRFGRRLRVRDWRVLDAGDGSGGFAGVLRAHGSRVVIDDRNTGATLLISDGDAAALRRHVGEVVVLVGHITGANVISVHAFKVLRPPPAAPVR